MRIDAPSQTTSQSKTSAILDAPNPALFGSSEWQAEYFADPGSRLHAHEWVSTDTYQECTVCVECGIHVSVAQSELVIAPRCPSSASGHHLHRFDAPLQNSQPRVSTLACCQCGESVSVLWLPALLPSSFIDPLFKGKSPQQRISILEALLQFAGGFLAGNTRPINSRNAKLMEKLSPTSTTSQVFQDVMAVLGFELRAPGEAMAGPHYHPILSGPIDPTNVPFGSTLRSSVALASQELVVLEAYLKRGMGLFTEAEFGKLVKSVQAPRTIYRLFGASVAYSTPDSPPSHLKEHYACLGCLSTVSDEKLKWSFLRCLEDMPTEKSLYLDAIIAIANARPTSPTLPEFIALERTSRNLHTSEDVRASFSLLHLQPTGAREDAYSAQVLVGVFQARAEESPGMLDELRGALRVVAAVGGCEDAIEVYLETGFVPGGVGGVAGGDAMDVACLTGDPDLPLGLQNFGNICYLNALIQFYLTIKPLREWVLHRVPDSPNTSSGSSTRDGRNAVTFLRHLKHLFVQLSQTQPLRTPAVSRDLAVCLLSGAAAASSPVSAASEAGNPVMLEDSAKALSRSGEDLLLNAQQDVGEFMIAFVDLMEKGYGALDEKGVVQQIKRLFFGKTVQHLEYRDARGSHHTTDKEDEEFLYLLIALRGDLYASLDEYFAPTEVEYEGKQAMRTVRFHTLPAILTFQLQRVQYDTALGCAVKSNAHLSFPDELQLSRYTIAGGSPKTYRLHAVLQHEGQAGFGHYRVFIRDQIAKGWYLYDDARVSKAMDAEVYEEMGGDRGAFCLMYVEVGSEVVETLVRGKGVIGN
ncbi:hypothetical protein BC830DRAFT_1165206 [Chytriomyces sp. MP71]|nr:hypothetical protein BC830DRAFT_1165206 [Chytriomyces sp. MP71]